MRPIAMMLAIVALAGCDRAPVKPVEMKPAPVVQNDAKPGDGAPKPDPVDTKKSKEDPVAAKKIVEEDEQDDGPWPEFLEDVPVDPSPIDAKIVEAWKAAGAKWRWQTAYQTFETKPDFKYYPELLPYFAIDEWKAGMIANLPPPDVPFALSLHGAEVRDEHLHELAGLKNLRRLNLNVNFKKLTGVGIKELAPLDLRQLFLYQTSLSDAGLKEVCEIKSLRELSIGASRVTDDGLKELVNLRRLQVLEMRGLKISDVGLKRVARCQNLRELQFGGADYLPFGPTDCTPLVKLTRLEKLDVYRANLTNTSVKGIGALTKLRHLNINGNPELSDPAVAGLASLKELRLLQISDTKVTSAGMKVLAGMENLTDLYLGRTLIDDTGLGSLADLKTLRYLELRGTKITDAGLETILTFKSEPLTVALPFGISQKAYEQAPKRRPKMLFTR